MNHNQALWVGQIDTSGWKASLTQFGHVICISCWSVYFIILSLYRIFSIDAVFFLVFSVIIFSRWNLFGLGLEFRDFIWGFLSWKCNLLDYDSKHFIRHLHFLSNKLNQMPLTIIKIWNVSNTHCITEDEKWDFTGEKLNQVVYYYVYG